MEEIRKQDYDMDSIIPISYKDIENVLRNRFVLVKQMEIRIKEMDDLCNSDMTVRDMIEAATYKHLAFDEKNVASAPCNAVKDLYEIIIQYNRNKKNNTEYMSKVIASTMRELEKIHRIYSCYLALSNPEEKKVLKYTYEEPVNDKVMDCFIWLAGELHCGTSTIKRLRRSALDNIIRLYYSYFNDNELLQRNKIFMKREMEIQNEEKSKTEDLKKGQE